MVWPPFTFMVTWLSDDTVVRPVILVLALAVDVTVPVPPVLRLMVVA